MHRDFSAARLRAGLLGLTVVAGLLMSFTSTAAAQRHAKRSSLTAREASSLVRSGVSRGKAQQAVAVQTQVAQTDAVAIIKKELGPNYAGVWLDTSTGRLAIGVPKSADSTAASQAATTAGIASVSEEVAVRSTWSELTDGQEEWNHRLSALFAKQQVETAINTAANAVVVTLSTDVPASVRAEYERAAASAAVNVNVKVAPPSQLAAVPATVTICYFPYCNKSITPGVKMYDASGECTTGPEAYSAANGYTYVLTAAHCTIGYGRESEPWISCYAHVTYCGGFGSFTPGSAELDEGGDLAAILINSPNWSYAGKDPVFGDEAEWKTSAAYPIGGARESYVGLANCHAGFHSGEQCGNVEAVNVTVSINYGLSGVIAVHGLVQDSACADGGDSGGPWFSTASPGVNGEVAEEGIMTAHAGECFAKPSWYEPLQTVLNHEGLILVTKYNEYR